MILANKYIVNNFLQEHILEHQDQAEVERIKVNVEECRKTLQKLGYADLTFEDFFAVTCQHHFFFLILLGTFVHLFLLS